MLAAFSELLADAAARGAAVGAFTAYNLEQAFGVLRAAEERRADVVLLVSPQSFRSETGALLLAALVAAARESSARTCVQLDHANDLGLIRRAFAHGAGAALADGSRLPLEANVALVREAAQLGEVECELGGIAGDEDVAAAVAAGALTDPDDAGAFVDATGPACLAVSIGNVHGTYREPPTLDWERLAAIRARVPVPLSLHGASGLPDDDLRRAVALGIAKVNVNTELRERYLEATAERLDEVRRGSRLLELNAAQVDAVAEVVAAKLEVFAAPAA